MYAIVETGGKQLRVAVGDVVNVEKLDCASGEEVALDRVLLISGDGQLQTGRPYIEGAKVVAKVIDQIKGPKIRGFKYKPKKNQRKRWGHRQPYTRLQIERIVEADSGAKGGE
ncbi:MAG: 50S ribosomal protein L21 [Limnochordia bacterium]|jgi:large subunit ribosomal protein L21